MITACYQLPSLQAWAFPLFIFLAGMFLFVLPAWLADRGQRTSNNTKENA